MEVRTILEGLEAGDLSSLSVTALWLEFICQPAGWVLMCIAIWFFFSWEAPLEE